MELKAIYNAIIVEPYELERQNTSHILVADLGNEKNKVGKVVAVGEGHYSFTGNLIPTQLKIGQIVILPTMGFSRFTLDNKEYFIGKENEVLGIIE